MAEKTGEFSHIQQRAGSLFTCTSIFFIGVKCKLVVFTIVQAVEIIVVIIYDADTVVIVRSHRISFIERTCYQKRFRI